MKISRFSVQHPVIIGMVLMALAVFGLVSIYDVNIEFMSDINIPQVYVISIYPGASSQDIEETVIDVMEDNFVTLEGFSGMESHKLVSSTVRYRSASAMHSGLNSRL